MKLNLPCITCRKNYWGTCFQQLTTYMCKKKKRKNYLRISHVDDKRKIACLANAKNGGKIVVTWSFLPFAFHVCAMLNLLYYIGESD